MRVFTPKRGLGVPRGGGRLWLAGGWLAQSLFLSSKTESEKSDLLSKSLQSLSKFRNLLSPYPAMFFSE
eukprot:COSAG01_NODE_325_length_18790_cov_64.371101_19_plen_69_part_00